MSRKAHKNAMAALVPAVSAVPEVTEVVNES